MNQAVEKHAEPVQHTRMKLSPRKILILLVLIFTAIITAAAIVVWYGNIYGRRHSDNTELFAVVDGVPEIIEEVYELTWVPDGYEYNSDESFGRRGDVLISHTYYNTASDKEIIFNQYAKSGFSTHSDIERSIWKKTEINGKTAIIVETGSSYGKNLIVLYDVGDYILKVSACESTETVIKIIENIEKK
jgi:hypothetical protein